MDLRIFTEPQEGASYQQLLAVAAAAEQIGYGAFFRSDHYLAMDGDGQPGPTDAWITLAGLARDTSTIRLGTLVSSATFRLPGPLAVAVSNVDQMSGGRVEFGLGAGWFAAEHAAFGIPFPPTKERFDRLEEQLAIITGMWKAKPGSNFEHDGSTFPVSGFPGLIGPTQESGIPIVMGGVGKSRTPALAARYASEFNIPFQRLDEWAVLYDRVARACEDINRDPATMIRSAAMVICIGRDEATVKRRAEALGRGTDELRESGLAGTFDEVRERLAAFEAAGAQRLYLQVMDLNDLDHLRDAWDALTA